MSANAAITSYIAELASVGAPTVVIVATLSLIASENRKYHLACMPGTAMEPCSPWDYDPVLDDGRLYAKGSTKESSGKDYKKLSDKQIEDAGIDAHELKKDYLGNNAPISKYDLYKDGNSGTIIILKKGGKGAPIYTGIHLK